MNICLSNIAAMNSMAVSKLAEGKQKHQLEAQSILQEAVVGLKHAFHTIGNGSLLPVERVFKSHSYRSVLANSLSIVDHASECASQSDGTFAFCDRMFLLSSLSGEAANDLSLVTLLTMYNLASVRHRVGLSTSSSGQIIKAIRMYELALATAENIPDDPRWDGIVLRVRCCLYNNMGHAHENLKSTQQSRFLLECLLNCLQQNDFCVAQAMYGSEEYEFFLQYVGFSPYCSFRAATAA